MIGGRLVPLLAAAGRKQLVTPVGSTRRPTGDWPLPRAHVTLPRSQLTMDYPCLLGWGLVGGSRTPRGLAAMLVRSGHQTHTPTRSRKRAVHPWVGQFEANQTF
jgi:hypothetical protein